jgi:hypothetical protein
VDFYRSPLALEECIASIFSAKQYAKLKTGNKQAESREAGSACYQLLTALLLGIVFYPEDRSNMFLQNGEILLNYKTLGDVVA